MWSLPYALLHDKGDEGDATGFPFAPVGSGGACERELQRH